MIHVRTVAKTISNWCSEDCVKKRMTRAQVAVQTIKNPKRSKQEGAYCITQLVEISNDLTCGKDI